MSKEYGIDPEAINSFESFFQVIPHFGPKHFRFIRRYPRKWSSMVKRAIDNVSPKAKARIIEKLRQIDKELVDCLTSYNGISTYDGNLSWFDNVIKYHIIQPFDGIINTSNSAYPYVCEISSFDIDSNGIFDVKSSFKVRRTADEMAKAARQLLQHSREIHFVDPLFENLNPRHVRPLLKFIETINARIGNIPISKVVYHFGNSIVNEANIISSIDKLILPRLAPGISVDFFRWPSTLMHNRFILTDIGGISFGIGLDDDDFNPHQKQFDDVSPLSYEICLEKDCGGIIFMNNSNPVFYSITGN